MMETLTTILQLTALLGAAATGAVAIGKFVILPIVHMAKSITEIHEAVQTQLLANGGSSLVDRVSLIEAAIIKHDEIWDRVQDRLGL